MGGCAFSSWEFRFRFRLARAFEEAKRLGDERVEAEVGGCGPGTETSVGGGACAGQGGMCTVDGEGGHIGVESEIEPRHKGLNAFTEVPKECGLV